MTTHWARTGALLERWSDARLPRAVRRVVAQQWWDAIVDGTQLQWPDGRPARFNWTTRRFDSATAAAAAAESPAHMGGGRDTDRVNAAPLQLLPPLPQSPDPHAAPGMHLHLHPASLDDLGAIAAQLYADGAWERGEGLWFYMETIAERFAEGALLVATAAVAAATPPPLLGMMTLCAGLQWGGAVGTEPQLTGVQHVELLHVFQDGPHSRSVYQETPRDARHAYTVTLVMVRAALARGLVALVPGAGHPCAVVDATARDLWERVAAGLLVS